MLNPGLILSWEVQHVLYLSHNDRQLGYTYCPWLMWLVTFLFGLYKFSLKDPLSWRRQYCCFLTVWIVGTGFALDLVLNAWAVLVLIWDPFAVAGGAQLWLIVFFVRCLCTRSNDRPGQEVKKFFWLLSTIQNEWCSRRMRGYSPPMCFLICTRKRPLKNICQESWTPSLVSFAGSSLTCIGLCVCLVFPSW